MIIDAPYLFDLMAERPAAFEKGTELVDRGEMQWLPTPVVAEVYYGVATARSDTTEDELRNRLLAYPRVEVDEEIARTAGDQLAATDDAVGANDAYIAAMAELLDDTVPTDNVDDFRSLGVPVESY